MIIFNVLLLLGFDDANIRLYFVASKFESNFFSKKVRKAALLTFEGGLLVIFTTDKSSVLSCATRHCHHDGRSSS